MPSLQGDASSDSVMVHDSDVNRFLKTPVESKEEEYYMSVVVQGAWDHEAGNH